jgi:DNA-binding NarL/FixJ family response regulator
MASGRKRSRPTRAGSPVAAGAGRPARSAAPTGFRARRFLAGDDELVVASFPLPPPGGRTHPPLTDAERAVMTALLEGISYAEIARRRRRSVSIVAKQANNTFRKLGVSSRSELAARGVLPARDGGEDA